MGGRSMLNKNGWGLREMLLLSGILILFLFVAIFYIMSFYKEMNKDMSRNYYRDLESDLKERAQVYIDDYYDGEFSGEITITRNVLRLYDLDVHLEDEEGNVCSGYVKAINDDGAIKLNSYIKCPSYVTEGYEEWRS